MLLQRAAAGRTKSGLYEKTGAVVKRRISVIYGIWFLWVSTIYWGSAGFYNSPLISTEAVCLLPSARTGNGKYRLNRVGDCKVFAQIGFFIIADNSLHNHLPVFKGGGWEQDDILTDTVTGVNISAAKGGGDGIA